MRLFATSAKGLAPLVARELAAVGATAIEEVAAGCAFTGSIEVAYRACLWSRVASRVLLPLAHFPAADERALYDGVRSIDWREHLGGSARDTLAVDYSASASALDHSQFGAQKTKDAIVDQFRDATGSRPSVDTEAPDVRVNVYLHDNQATVSIDLSGDSLHRRGWRQGEGPAPLKETLAAALLYLADWPAQAAAGVPFVDPMCGAGTLPIEAAWMAADVAPGLLRRRFGFLRWRGHDAALWRGLVEEARGRRRPITSPIYAWDEDPRAIAAATQNAARAGVSDAIAFARRPWSEAAAPAGPPGLLVMNPPYGERLGEVAALAPLYEQIGNILRHRFTGYRAFLLTASPELAKRIGLRAARRHILFNGALECRLLEVPIAATAPTAPMRSLAVERATPFANRLRKNVAHLKKWAKREGVSCYRVYDADLLEYAVAIDLYESAAQVQEYAPPATVDPQLAAERLGDLLAVLPDILGLSASQLFVKERRRQRPDARYTRQPTAHQLVVHEGGHQFVVNLSEYLDTGLFLDQRRLRALIATLAPGRSFLNLFSYTGSATVYAAAAGASRSVSVDVSNRYLAWAEENFALNRISGRQHRLVREDVIAYLESEKSRFDVIFCAPPTYSNSKSRSEDFDLQRDHVALLERCMSRLQPDGTLLFATHFRKFKLDAAALPALAIENITKKTLPLDFARDPKFHATFQIRRR